MNQRRTYIRILGAALTLLTIVLIAAACGSSGTKKSKDTSTSAESSSTAASTPTTTATAAATTATTAASGGGQTSGCAGAKPNTQQFSAEPPMTVKATDKLTARLTTSKGIMVVNLSPRTAPHAVNNFVFLARKGFYHCVLFHRIMKDFMVQTGDPQGTGQGGPGYTIIDDKTTDPYAKGTVAMANTGQPNTGGSQFFIVHGADAGLPSTYPVFGKVTSGLDVLDKIATVAVGPNAQGESSAPTSPVYLIDVKISG